MSACVPSDLLQHVYQFLVQCNFHKSAKALQKATNESLSCTQSEEEAGLLEFYTFYQKKHAGKRTVVTMEMQNESEETPPTKKRKRNEHTHSIVATNGLGDGEVGGAQYPAETNGRGDGEVGGAQSTAETNGRGVSQESGRKRKKSKRKEQGIEQSDGGEEVKTLVVESTPASSGLDTSCHGKGEDSDTDTKVDGVNEETTPTLVSAVTSEKNRKRKSGGNIFRRVTEDMPVDPRLQDNSFEAKARSQGSWGERANRDLKFTKGKSFRHEKTKKKRGTYKGGAIDTSICSFKFDSD